MLNGKLIKNKLYFRIIFSFILLSLLVVIATSLLFANIYLTSTYKQISNEYQNGLENGDKTLENIIKELDQVYISMQLNMDIYVFLNATASEPETENRARIQSRIMRQINPYIRSIHLYNGMTGSYVYVGPRDFSLDQLENIENWNQHRLNSRRNIVLTRPLQEIITEKQNEYAISLVYYENSSNDDRLANAVIINLDEQAIEHDVLGRYEGLTFIVGNDGTIISCPDRSLVEKNISREIYFKNIIKTESNKGSFTQKIDNDNKVITYFKNSQVDWYIINIRPNLSITHEIQQKTRLIIIICLISIIIFSVLGYILSRSIYSPIRKITDVFNHSRFGNKPENKSEVALIMDVFNETIDFMQELEYKNKSSLVKLKETFLRSLLCSNNPSDWEGEHPALEIEFNNLIITALSPDHASDTDAKDSLYRDSAIFKAIQETFTADYKYELVNVYNNEIYLLLNFKNEQRNDFNTLISSFENLKDKLANAGLSITVGIGGAANKMEECHPAYEKAHDFVKYRFVLGYGRTIYQKLIDNSLENSLGYPKEMEDKLFNAVKMNRRDDFEDVLDQTVTMLKNYIYSDAAMIFMEMSLSCVRTMNSIIGESNKQLQIKFRDVSRIFGKMETIDEAQDWMMKLFDGYQKAVAEITQLKSKDYYKLIEEAKSYIQKNYNDINLCVELLADKMGYSVNYFAKLFRENTGIYINDYIRHVRIEKAKELLRTSDCKVNEIADMTGFVNSRYFFAAFKKEVGLTPASFRGYLSSDNDDQDSRI